MKDPLTVAFELPRYGTRLYRWLGALQITIWHRDKNGCDGACGWSYPHLTKTQQDRLRQWAWSEGRDPYFLRCPGKVFNGSRTDAETLYRALVLETARALDVRMSVEEATKFAITRVHRGGFEDAARAFCWVPGYHTNNKNDSAKYREDHFYGVMFGVARQILAERRPWFRHPKWHIHHWRIQVHCLQKLRRWLFERCAGCGKGYSWGYCPTSNWGGKPTWHSECYGKASAHCSPTTDIESHSGGTPGEKSVSRPADHRGIASARSSEGGNAGQITGVSIQSCEPVDSNSVSVGRLSPEHKKAMDVDAAPSLSARRSY